METTLIVDELLSLDWKSVDLKRSLHSQLFFCLFQKHLKPNIIKYICGKFKDHHGNDKLEEELARIIIRFLKTYGRSVCIYRNPNLLSFDIITLLEYSLPSFSEQTIASLQEHYFKKGVDFFDLHMKLLQSRDNLKRSSNYETIPKYLFQLNEFKIMEYFFKFNLVNKDFVKCLTLYLMTFSFENFDHIFRMLCTFVLYFLRNNFFSIEEVMDILMKFCNENLVEFCK